MAAQVLDENKYIATVTFDSQWEINDQKEAITGGQGEIVFVVSRNIPNIQGCAKVKFIHLFS